jgi:hypothetical protein
MQYSLDRAIHDAKFPNNSGQTIASTFTLTDEQQSAIFELIGKRCRSATKAKIGRRLELPLSLWPSSYGIFSRLILWDDSTNVPYYICGQSWTDEMRTLRECILDK